MLLSIKKMLCRIFGHKWQSCVKSLRDNRGASVTRYCKRCGKVED
jgi:hypothetical protein